MTNTNCLEGIRCPACGQEDRFRITALITCVVTDNGSEPLGDHEWDGESSTQCPQCGFNGKLNEFSKPTSLPPDPENMNDSRAEWAGLALSTFMQRTGADQEDALAAC